jgi:hypothetical protein
MKKLNYYETLIWAFFTAIMLTIALPSKAQAQNTICDSIEISITVNTDWFVELETNLTTTNFPQVTSVQSYFWGKNGCLMGTDSSVSIDFYTDTTTLYAISLVTTYCDLNMVYTCTTYDTLVWNNGSWMMMSMMQQPYFCCDSITYWTDQSQGFNVGLDTTGIVHNPDSLEVWWSVCTNGLCYSDQGMYAYFPQVTTLDTVKVGYDVYLYENGVAEVCSREDWLVFDGTNWILLNMNPTSINEITFNKINDNKMYDLLGREVIDVPIGTIYIKNNQKFVRTR